MDLESRIQRRQRRESDQGLVRDYESLSPVFHAEEPTDRGPVFEKLLDHLDPVFDGTLPPNAYVHGPMGAGKSAVVTALFAKLDALPTDGRSIIYTSTRAEPATSPAFVYVDTRATGSEFAFYHAVLDSLTEEAVPEHGIGTETLRSRLMDLLDGRPTGAVVAVDHVDDPDGTDPTALVDLFAGLPSNTSWLAVGQSPPTEVRLTDYTAHAIAIEPYRQQTLVDVLMTRASDGLTQQALEHAVARRIARWADGNAHHALAVLLVAAATAESAGRDHITGGDVAAAIDEMPSPCVELGRVLALPANRRAVLRELIDLDDDATASVTRTTTAISDRDAVDLSPGTVKRFLYEMAEAGIVDRVKADGWSGQGRPPSRVEPRFPPTAFRRLYDLGV
ncbi:MULTISPECIES: Cdc6/Cdc18 family protein [Haloarcula]|uniref:Cdc6/Cdc18 family protein n=1 Tax=Haloarcula TaxID=2237 RepID=UPI0023EB0EBA|nr:AAA family ATPase [Halomicroarcula sp. XH51]